MSTLKIKFVLNEPRNPKNIGAAARGMANFGFLDLAVVNPYSKAWREKRSAVHASAVVEKAKKFKSLKEALKSCHVVIGTSAGYRRQAGGRWIDLEDLPPIISKNAQAGRRMAIVFGSEKSGLSNEDLDYCRFIVKIPTVPACPSMNLAQAVAVIAYAIRTERPTPLPVSNESAPIPVVQVEHLVKQALEAFEKAGLLKGWDLARSEQRFRRAFNQLNLAPVSLAMLHGIFRWVIKKSHLSSTKS